MIDNTEKIREIAQSETTGTVVGVVTTVYEHTETDDRSNHEVNVRLANDREEFRRIPVHTTRNGHISVPKEGDFVEVDFLNGRMQRPYVSGFAHDAEARAPLGRQGHWRHEFDNESDNDLYLEAEPRDHSQNEPDTVRMAVKKDGLSDPVARIELDLSGSDPVIRLTRGEDEQGNTDMGLELDFGSGAFTIGDGSGYGIVSDGNGNFTWYEQSIDFVDDGTTISW